MIDNVIIGEKIKSLRKQANLTQTELADKMGVSFQAVSNWERGLTQLTLDNLVEITNIFGVSMDMLISSKEKETEQLFLGIDGGGTKTEFAVIDKEGNLYKKFVLSASNPNDIGIDNSIKVIAQGINQAIKEFPRIHNIFAGIAGAFTGNNKVVIKKGLKDIFPSLEIDVESDVANLLACVDNCDSALIIGTGIAFVCVVNGEINFVGGWGYMLDCFGSGYDFGREVIRTALNEIENNGEKSIITQLFLKEYELKGRNIIEEVYKKGKSFVAKFSRIIFEAYDLGDKRAKEIIDEHAKEVAKLIKVAQEKYNRGRRIVISGGIAQYHEKPYLEKIKEYVNTSFIIPKLPQIFGACKKSVSNKCDIIDSKQFENNFSLKYNGGN